MKKLMTMALLLGIMVLLAPSLASADRGQRRGEQNSKIYYNQGQGQAQPNIGKPSQGRGLGQRPVYRQNRPGQSKATGYKGQHQASTQRYIKEKINPHQPPNLSERVNPKPIKTKPRPRLYKVDDQWYTNPEGSGRPVTPYWQLKKPMKNR
ncbi:MAG: hypothetical protein LBE80_02720 [Deltaproteobacteria bacterium]|jgi:hypothetical protein|nr:hypothetical protein [Deltaproteobacteria bacterium]